MNIESANSQRMQDGLKQALKIEPGSKRDYYVDWIKALSIHFVIAVHCVQLSVGVTDIQSAAAFERNQFNMDIIQKANGFIKGLVQIGIPIFFYASGLNLAYFNTEQKGFKVFFINKFMRLIVPFIVAYFLILAPRLYLA